MNQRWWIAIVAVVGIGLAVLLFPRPDTGGDIPGANPGNVDPTDFKNGENLPPNSAVNPRIVGRPRPAIDPDRVRSGIKPGAENRAALRNRPEAIYASKLITPFSAIRFTLMKEGSEPAKALAEEVGSLMNDDLRKVRLDPDSVPWADLEKEMDATVATIAASPFASDETIARSLGRYKEFIDEYHSAKAPVPPGTPSDAPPGAPPGTPEAIPVEQ